MYPIDTIKQVYKDKWTVQEYFKYIKEHCQFDKFSETKYENKNVLSEGMYSTFLLKLIYNKGFDYRYLNKFFKTYVILYINIPNRKFDRVCNNPHKKSYLKFNKNKKTINSDPNKITDPNKVNDIQKINIIIKVNTI